VTGGNSVADALWALGFEISRKSYSEEGVLMKIAISQPAYLPWLGYFDLIDQVDTFVLLDSVQFAKQSWQQRNRIKTPSGLQWLTVPVVRRGHFGQRIFEVQIRDAEFWRKHLRAIELNYRRAPFFQQYFPEFGEILERHSGQKLFHLTRQLIGWFSHVLGLETKILRSSELEPEGRRGELLVNLCRLLRAESYLSPLGSAAYLMDASQLFSRAGIVVGFQHYEHPEYRQRFPPFESHASVLDLIFNEGPNSLAILRSGRREAFAPQEVAGASTRTEDRCRRPA
jgi:WbqC-like protein family